MGKVEKIVVLSVLFLIAVILAVSLQSGGKDEVAAADRRRGGAAEERNATVPLTLPSEAEAVEETGQRFETGLPRAEEREGIAARERETGSTGVLSATVERPDARRSGASREPERLEPRALPASEPVGDLVSLEHLVETVRPDLMAYTCRGGDTFKKVAARYYGDASKAHLLQRYNEGLDELTSGLEILIPVEDDGFGAVAEYEVLEGESLWVISKKVYGKGHLWNEIFEANRDRLKSPDAVRAGDVLRIP